MERIYNIGRWIAILPASFIGYLLPVRGFGYICELFLPTDVHWLSYSVGLIMGIMGSAACISLGSICCPVKAYHGFVSIFLATALCFFYGVLWDFATHTTHDQTLKIETTIQFILMSIFAIIGSISQVHEQLKQERKELRNALLDAEMDRLKR